MSLINCKECGEQISSNAKACPHCGEPNAIPISNAQKAGSSIRRVFGFLLFLAGAGILIWATQHSPNIGFGEALMAGPGHYVINREMYSKVLMVGVTLSLGGIFFVVTGSLQKK